MKSCNLLFAALFAGPIAWSQTATLTIEQCYQLGRENYPLIKQKELLVKSKEYTIANAHSGYLPQLAIYGQATYQSDVTRVPIDLPGVTPPAKDQYKIYGEVTQTIYDGGNIKQQGALQEINTQVEDQRTEVELYKIKERINQLYFGILLSDDQLIQTSLLKKDVLSSLTKTESAIRNGIAFKSNADLLKAELLRTDQRMVELKATRKAYLTMLGYFIHQELAETVTLARPALIVASGVLDIKRPELQLYQHQTALLIVQNKLGNTRNMPRIGLFFQGGYGRPAINVLKNDFDAYYIGGVRLNWSLGGFYNSKRDKQLLDVATQQVSLQKELFIFNTNLSLAQQQQEVARLQELISIDNQIIELRTRIKNTSHAQHENGVITTNDYLRDLNAEDQSKQNLLLHNTQLSLAQYNYQTTSGN